jgi:ABC transporter substrate binding protein
VRPRTFGIISSLALGILSAPLASDAQESTKVPRLGYISPGDVPPYDNAFLQGLQDQGYIVPGEIPRYDDVFWRGLLKRGYFAGQKIRIEVRATNGDFERAPELTAELVRLNVDVIFAIPALLAKAAQQAVQNANKTTPIVFGPEYDPVGIGLVASLARPGGKMTGLALTDPEFEVKRLQILKEAFPRISSAAYLTNLQTGIRSTSSGLSRRWTQQPDRWVFDLTRLRSIPPRTLRTPSRR